jgi:hypothetical protein
MEAQIQLVSPEVQQQANDAMLQVTNIQTLTIVDVEDYKYAQGLMKEIKNRIKELTETRMEQTRPLDISKSKIMAFFAAPLEKLEKAKAYLNRIMVDFTEEQERKRREEERRLQEEAKKRIEEETLRAALEAEAIGEIQEAEAIIQQPIEAPAIKIVSEIPKSKESHIRETWSAELISLKDLVEGIHNGTAPLLAVKADMVFLNEQARAYKQVLKIAGVKAISRKTQV